MSLSFTDIFNIHLVASIAGTFITVKVFSDDPVSGAGTYGEDSQEDATCR